MFKHKKNYFNLQTVCEAPVCWSKYTTTDRQTEWERKTERQTERESELNRQREREREKERAA